MEIEKLVEEIKAIDARILTEEARATPMPLTSRSQMIVRHLRRAREALADARLALRLAKVEAERKPGSTG